MLSTLSYSSVILLILTAGNTAVGAEINKLVASSSPSIIIIKGKIDVGDALRFDALVENDHRVHIVLSSPGGMIQEALSIGSTIRLRGFTTSVADECVSSCGLIWLAGVRRYLMTGTRVGFHAAYHIVKGKAVETGMANAEVGSYLTRLGLRLDAIKFVTAAPPEDVRWLSLEDATRLGIEIEKDDYSRGGATFETPLYQRRPVKNTNSQEIEKIADWVSHLVMAQNCKEFQRVDADKLLSEWEKAIDLGEKLGGPNFHILLESELKKRAEEARIDGLESYCAELRRRFEDSGIEDIFITQ